MSNMNPGCAVLLNPVYPNMVSCLNYVTSYDLFKTSKTIC